MTAAIITSNGRPSRVFLANFLGGPLVVTVLVIAAIAVYLMTRAVFGARVPGGDAISGIGVWPVLLAVVFFLSNAIAGLGAAIYATVQVNRRGTYSVLLAAAIAVAVAFLCNVVGLKTATGVPLAAMFFAALSAAVAGWLARRSGAAFP